LKKFTVSKISPIITPKTSREGDAKLRYNDRPKQYPAGGAA
jgi:hypothetical protein